VGANLAIGARARDGLLTGKHRGFSGLGKIFGVVLDRFFQGP
jgi:hypothetical protein